MSEIGGLVDVVDGGQLGVPQAVRAQPATRVVHDPGRAPCHAVEQRRHRVPQADQRVAAVVRRHEDRVVHVERIGGLAQSLGVEAGCVGADQQCAIVAGQCALQRMVHAGAQIAIGLLRKLDQG